ncbi:hypothetical protein J518_4110 [Acinetobacter baumannii 1419130]|nr:hypothetical protein J518_4110 [Acinetobacter baumannii 1419130]
MAVPSGVLGQIGRVGLEVGRVGPQAQARPLRVEIELHQAQPAVADAVDHCGVGESAAKRLLAALVVAEELEHLVAVLVRVDAVAHAMEMAVQHRQDLVMAGNQAVPEPVGGVALGVQAGQVQAFRGLALTPGIEELVDGHDGRHPGKGLQNRLGPVDHLAVGRHLQAQVQEAVGAAGEDLGAVGALPERGNIPGLVLEERRLGAEVARPVLQRAAMDAAHAGQVQAVQVDRAGLRGVVGVGPHVIVVMVARDHGEGQLAGEDLVGRPDGGDLDVQHLLRRRRHVVCEQGADDGPVAAPRMSCVHVRAHLVLPHVAQRGGESDLTAIAHRVAGDEVHHVPEQLARVEREARRALVAVAHIVLRVGHDGDGEAGVFTRCNLAHLESPSLVRRPSSVGAL